MIGVEPAVPSNAGITASAPVPPPNPDAELIALCAEIDKLEDKINSFPHETLRDEEASAILVQRLKDQQDPLIDMICNMTATTLEGLQARARTIIKWAPDMLDNPHDIAEMMVATLLQDLSAMGAN
jgi:hypothetical protein